MMHGVQRHAEPSGAAYEVAGGAAGPPAQRVLYLDGAGEPVFAVVHEPAPANARDTAVILCPPFGWEEVCAYRSLRLWATQLASDGYTSLRLSYPGTGDSGGSPQDPDRVDAWVASVGSASAWLRSEVTDCRIVAVGIGLGGMVACLAAAADTLDDLVLWGTPTRGRLLVRQLRAFGRLEHARFYDGGQTAPEPVAGQVEAGGFVLSAETVQRLEAIDLGSVHLPYRVGRRALLLERDGLAVDTSLQAMAQAAGVEVTVAPGEGFGEMTSHPQQARAPLSVIERVREWLDAGCARSDPSGSSPSTTELSEPTTQMTAGQDRAAIRETALTIDQSFGRLTAVLTEPCDSAAQDVCVILLNAGAVRRIGPNRMWVEAGRRWATRGMTTLRLDVGGVGDADGDDTPYTEDSAFYVPELKLQVVSAMDFLQSRGVAKRFVLTGLCASANWSFHLGLEDARVCGMMLINLRAFFWDAGLLSARDLRTLMSKPFSLSKIRRAATGGRMRSFIGWVLGAPARATRRHLSREAATADRKLDTALEELVQSGKPTLLLFSDGEPVYDELARSGRLQRLTAAPSVTVEQIHVHAHTLRPAWAQTQAHVALDRALTRMSALPDTDSAPASSLSV